MFAAEDVSVVLLYYLEAEIAGLPDGPASVRERALAADGLPRLRETLASLLDPADPKIRSRLRGIPAGQGVDIPEMLASTAYRGRVIDAAVERLFAGPEAPALRIHPADAVRPQDGFRFGLVFGAETVLFQDTVLALQADAEASGGAEADPVRVLGVHHGWLDARSRATRAIVVDQPGRVCEVALDPPAILDAAQILHLPHQDELGLHRRISVQLERAGVAQINPYGRAAELADDKHLSCEHWSRTSGAVEVPACGSVRRGSAPREVIRAVRGLLGGRSTRLLVVQPRHGTEGRYVEAWSLSAAEVSALSDAHPLVIHAVRNVLPHDDLIIREARGNVRLIDDGERLSVAFRVNVSWDGRRFVAESGFAQVAPDGKTFAASRGRGGRVLPLDEALRSLCYETDAVWRRYAPSSDDVSRMAQAAQCALETLNAGMGEARSLKQAGIDLVPEVGERGLTPVVLEANARPAGLSSSRALSPLGSRIPGPKVTDALFHYLRRSQRERSTQKCAR